MIQRTTDKKTTNRKTKIAKLTIQLDNGYTH